jgi:NitT/TauT family transport system substrate-binding protein
MIDMPFRRLKRAKFDRPSAPSGRLMASLLCCWLAWPLAGCSGANETENAATPDKVRAVVLPILFTAPFHIAAAEGYFEDEGLDVEFIRLTRNIDAIPALAQGDVDVGAGQLTVAMLNAIAGGARIRVVADVGHLAADGCTFAGIVARKELFDSAGTIDAERLRGRRLEFDIALPHAYWLDAALGSLGLRLDDMEIVDVPTAATVDAFLNGAFDITSVSEPRVTQMTETGVGEVWLGIEELFPGYPQSLVFFGRTFLDERPEVGERFMAALLRGIRQYNEGKTQRNLEIMESALRLSRDELTAACWVSMHDDAHVVPAGLIDYQRWALQQDLIERVLAADEFLDLRFLDGGDSGPPGR